MLFGEKSSFKKIMMSSIVIFILMYINQLFFGPFLRVGLNILIFGSYLGIILISKSWWNRKKFIVAVILICLESLLALIWFHETKIIYFLVILMIYSVNRLTLSKSTIPAILVIFMMAFLYFQQERRDDLFHFLSFLLLSIVIYLGFWNRMQRNEMFELNKKHLVELQEAYDQLQEASVKDMRYAVLEERTRIAREIHDAVGHHLTSLIVQMQALRYMINIDSSKAQDSIDEMLIVAREGLQDIRRSVHSLADDQSKSGLIPLKALLSRMESTTSINYSFHLDVDEEEISMDIYGVLFKVLQEAITNVIRHSQATFLDVSLKKEKGNIVLQIKDNGVVKSIQKMNEGFGLKTMRARLEEKGGQLEFLNVDPHGFKIIAKIPEQYRITSHENDKDDLNDYQ